MPRVDNSVAQEEGLEFPTGDETLGVAEEVGLQLPEDDIATNALIDIPGEPLDLKQSIILNESPM